MADSNTTAYVYVSNKDQWDTTETIWVERDDNGNVTKEIVKGGDPVELTEEQYQTVSERFNLRKASDKQIEDAAGDEPSAPADSDPNPAGTVPPENVVGDPNTSGSKTTTKSNKSS